jgi:hypothetical protein
VTLNNGAGRFGVSGYRSTRASDKGFRGFVSGLTVGVVLDNCCFEGWFKTSTTGKQVIFGSYIDSVVGTWAVWVTASGKCEFAVRPSGSAYLAIATSSTTVTDGLWHHVAISRTGGTTRLFLDGVLEASSTAADSVNGTAVSNNFAVGRSPVQTVWALNGDVDEVRITNGQARYTATFTPPASAFPRWEERTVLLVHGDAAPLEDLSCYQTKTVALTGSASVEAAPARFGKSILVPNVGTSTLNGVQLTDHMDFDFGTGDFTVELNAYRNANTYVGTLFYATLGGGEFSFKVGTDGLIDIIYRSSGGSQTRSNVATFPLTTWQHAVFQRRGLNWETYLEGVLIDSVAITGGAGSTVNSAADWFFGRTNVSSAESWNGHLDEIRVTKGAARYAISISPPAAEFPSDSSDPYWASVLLRLPLNSNFTDASTYGRSPTVFGNAAVSSAASQFGGASAVFDGTGDYATYPASVDWAFGVEDFTIECWINVSAFPGTGKNGGILSYGNSDTTYAWVLYIAPNSQFVNFQLRSSLSVTWFFEAAMPNVVLGTWAHIAVTRSDTMLSFWLDGALIGVRGLPSGVQVASTTGSLDVGTLYSASGVTNS